jgi:hypothetical protein
VQIETEAKQEMQLASAHTIKSQKPVDTLMT